MHLTGPTRSETWETVVPFAAPRYKTLAPGFMYILLTPLTIQAHNFDLNAFQTLYSVFIGVPSVF